MQADKQTTADWERMSFELSPLNFTCEAERELIEIARRSAGDWVVPALDRFERIFRLRTPFAPGLAFVGAQGAAPLVGGTAPESVRLNAGGTGLGLTEALVSCLGEGLEFLSQVERDGDVIEVGSLSTVSGRLASEIGDWLSACYPSLLGVADDVLDWRTAINVATGRPTLVPADLCLRRSAYRRHLPILGPLSTGCAVGPTFDDAASRAILELVERDAIALWWLGGRPGRPLAPIGSIAIQSSSMLTQLRLASTRRTTWLLDITTDVGIPVIVALSADQSGRRLACGFAARVVASEAARAAILEMCQVEAAFALIEAKALERGPTGLDEIDHRHLRRGMLDVFTCALLHPAGTPQIWDEDRLSATAMRELIKRLENRGIGVWLCDLTRPDFGVAAARAIAPALQAFPSRHRSQRLLSAVETFGGPPLDAAGVDIM